MTTATKPPAIYVPAIYESSVTDFQFKIEPTPTGGVQISILYAGRPGCGMYGFGGSLKTAKEDMASVLRKLADDVERIEK